VGKAGYYDPMYVRSSTFDRGFSRGLSEFLEKKLRKITGSDFFELLFSKKILAEFDLPINLEGEKYCACHDFDKGAPKILSQVNNRIDAC
jgi:hypothetical protein